MPLGLVCIKTMPRLCARERGEVMNAELNSLRVDVPLMNVVKFKEVLLYILSKIGAKPNVGQTVIYKLLYFIDFDFYELYEEQILGLRYIKNTY